MAGRGGRQRIPRPATARPGGPPPWAHLSPERRRFSLADVRAACAQLPPPVRPPTPPAARAAAVLVPIFEEAGDGGQESGEARVILTKRPETMPSHQGEIAFPGGKLEESVDESLAAAARREAQEEIGLDPSLVEIVAELDSITTVMGRFVLTPFVGLLPGGRPAVVPDPREVVRVFDVALSELLDDAAYREERWDIPETLGPEAGIDRSIHFFEVAVESGFAGSTEEAALAPPTNEGGETVWGATARILADFLGHLAATR